MKILYLEKLRYIPGLADISYKKHDLSTKIAIFAVKLFMITESFLFLPRIKEHDLE
jgi:hypothetical protein